jgi:hypothetical protein
MAPSRAVPLLCVMPLISASTRRAVASLARQQHVFRSWLRLPAKRMAHRGSAGKAGPSSRQPTRLRVSMLHAHRRYALALVGVSLLVGLGLAEGLLRYHYHQAHRKMAVRDPGRELCTMRATDPRLIYTYVPNRCGANAHGYVDEDHTYEKSPTTYRIVIIGDSVASGLSRTTKFGRVLEHRLNTTAAPQRGRTYEVIVLARSGYATVQELVLLEEEAFQ